MNHKLPFLFSTPLLFLGLFGIFGVILFALPAIAQNVEDEDKKERIFRGRIGFRFSGYGLTHYGDLPLSDIYSSEDDIMPYPISFFSMQYDNYEANIAWAGGKNDNIFKFAIRYNRFGKHMYIYGGPVLWRFNKKYHFTKYVCEYVIIDHPYSESCKEGTEMIVEIETDRPNGKSLTFGINAGVGIEYTLFDVLVLSHEIEFF